MSDFGLSIFLGIGDILNYWAMLEAIKYRYDNIYIKPQWHLVDDYRHGSENFKKFTRDLLGTIFIDPKYKIVDYGNYPIITTDNLITSYKLQPMLPRCTSLCGDSCKEIDGEYIIVTTRVREYVKKKFNLIKDPFINTLNRLSEKYKIVIIGESEVDNNIENEHYGFYSIYEYLKEVNNVIDLTVPVSKDIEFPFSIEALKADCALMSKAKCVITLGCGGNLALGSATANKLIGLRDDSYINFDSMYKGEQIFVTRNSTEFLNKIGDL